MDRARAGRAPRRNGRLLGEPPFLNYLHMHIPDLLIIQGYSEIRLTQYPSLTPILSEYIQGTLGPHWEQPGRSILDDHLRRVPLANDVNSGAWADESRLYFTGV